MAQKVPEGAGLRSANYVRNIADIGKGMGKQGRDGTGSTTQAQSSAWIGVQDKGWPGERIEHHRGKPRQVVQLQDDG